MKIFLVCNLVIISVIGCSENHNDNSRNEGINENQQIEILKAIQANMSQEEYEYKIHTVVEGLKSWDSGIEYEVTTSNDHDFLIYFTNRNCLMLPDYDILSFCLIAARKNAIGAAYPFFAKDKTYKGTVLLLFNEFYRPEVPENLLTNLVAHEVGHVFGFTHYNNGRNIMNTYVETTIPPNEEDMLLMRHAVIYKEIHPLYGHRFMLRPPQTHVKFYIQTLSARTK